ncbi:MAG: DNA methylase [Pseudomonadota bacterium]
MTIERNYSIPFVAELALNEKQVQQNYRPIIAVHKWFARRPGTLFRALMLSEFADQSVTETFFQPHDFLGKKVVDPFMGGGTPLIEANRVGCDVQGYDINPMAAWIVKEEIERVDLAAYREAADQLLLALNSDLGRFYRTDCPIYGDAEVPVKYFIWVKEIDCSECGADVPLFPGYRIADDTRHPAHVIVCSKCHALNECASKEDLGQCSSCNADLILEGPAKRNRCACPSCGHINRYPQSEMGPLRHRLIAIEYFNPERKKGHQGRFFKAPDEKDLARTKEIEELWAKQNTQFVPTQEILPGDETDRLHRWGYRYYRQLFNARQLYGLEKSASLIAAIKNKRVRHALATNLSDLLRYQNMLCRYDTMALKSLDIFSVHGFPVGLMQVESNLLGIVNSRGINVGSGGWSNIVDKYAKAKRYCDAPYETRREGKKKVQVPIPGEWIGEQANGCRKRSVSIHCASSTDIEIETASLDAVFTDPPYFANVQYGELMDFCYVWLRALVGHDQDGFELSSSRNAGELTGNQTAGRTIEHFTEGLAAVYSKMATALKPGAPLAFTYHHNKLDSYEAIAVAILDSGLNCSATIPCPAEMGGSIHISGTSSSIIDTVFVNRSSGSVQTGSICKNGDELASLVAGELAQLKQAGVKPRIGDARCITFGHLTRLAIWNLHSGWDATLPTAEKLALVGQQHGALGDPEEIAAAAEAVDIPQAAFGPLFENTHNGEREYDAIAF